MKIDEENKVITFRQSWLDTATTCPERARLSVVAPEWDLLDSDEAFLGTAAHYGIESFLRSEGDPAHNAYEYAIHHDPDAIKYTKRANLEEIAEIAAMCAQAWYDEIWPHVPKGGHTEVTFKVPLFDYRGYRIMLNGTADYVVPAEIWDWKSAGRAYEPWEKHRYAVQPSAYATVLNMGLMPHVDAAAWPITFRYGVMYKPGTYLKRNKGSNKTGVETDIVTVQRTAADRDWLYARIKQHVDLALACGLHDGDSAVKWPMVDDHGLCSSKWCPWWSICKGAFISEDQYTTPSQAILPRNRS